MSKYDQQVYQYLTTIPYGKVVTYQDIALFLDNKYLCRVVGNIIHKNPEPIKYLCFKVVNAQEN